MGDLSKRLWELAECMPTNDDVDELLVAARDAEALEAERAQLKNIVEHTDGLLTDTPEWTEGHHRVAGLIRTWREVERG